MESLISSKMVVTDFIVKNYEDDSKDDSKDDSQVNNYKGKTKKINIINKSYKDITDMKKLCKDSTDMKKLYIDKMITMFKKKVIDEQNETHQGITWDSDSEDNASTDDGEK